MTSQEVVNKITKIEEGLIAQLKENVAEKPKPRISYNRQKQR